MIKVASFKTVHKGTARGVEAADCVAWHWNKYYMDKLRNGKGDDLRKDFAALIHAARDRVNYCFATGPTLKYFLSRVPPEALEKTVKQAADKPAVQQFRGGI